MRPVTFLIVYLLGVLIVEEVGPVGIGLHVSENE